MSIAFQAIRALDHCLSDEDIAGPMSRKHAPSLSLSLAFRNCYLAPMYWYTKVVISGVFALVLFDAVAAIGSRAFHFPYTRASVASFLICTFAGFLIGKSAKGRHAVQFVIAGAILGLTDATLGWAVAYALGVGKLRHELTPNSWIIVILLVMVTYTLFTALGMASAQFCIGADLAKSKDNSLRRSSLVASGGA